jgi:hypothetical protein
VQVEDILFEGEALAAGAQSLERLEVGMPRPGGQEADADSTAEPLAITID